MKAKIHRLTSAGPIIRSQNREVLVELRELYNRAKKAEIKGFGIFIVTGANAVETWWVSGCACQNDMISGAALLSWKVNQAAVES